MAKHFVRIKQEFYIDAIIDINKNETNNSIYNRIKDHIDNNGGAESIIVLGGNITFEKLKRKPTEEDEDTYECID